MDSINGSNMVIEATQNMSALHTAVLKKARDIQKQQGENTINMLNSLPNSSNNSKNGGIDVFA